jgi:hypothetical protein
LDTWKTSNTRASLTDQTRNPKQPDAFGGHHLRTSLMITRDSRSVYRGVLRLGTYEKWTENQTTKLVPAVVPRLNVSLYHYLHYPARNENSIGRSPYNYYQQYEAPNSPIAHIIIIIIIIVIVIIVPSVYCGVALVKFIVFKRHFLCSSFSVRFRADRAITINGAQQRNIAMHDDNFASAGFSLRARPTPVFIIKLYLHVSRTR